MLDNAQKKIIADFFEKFALAMGLVHGTEEKKDGDAHGDDVKPQRRKKRRGTR